MPDFYTESTIDLKKDPVMYSPVCSPLVPREPNPRYFGSVNTRQLGSVNNQAPISFMYQLGQGLRNNRKGSDSSLGNYSGLAGQNALEMRNSSFGRSSEEAQKT